MSLLSFLDRSHTVAKPGFSRWMVPPAALCVHFCHRPGLCAERLRSPDDQTHRHCPNRRRATGSSLTRVDLLDRDGVSRWLGRSFRPLGRGRRPAPRDVHRRALLGRRIFSCRPSAFYTHTLWLIYIGYGVLGGCGLGIGYIAPVSTLIKWFPDRPGMATGMAIMGFGGGAFIASPLSVWLLGKFTTATHVGVAETFIVMGCIYFFFMIVGSIIVRVPAPG